MTASLVAAIPLAFVVGLGVGVLYGDKFRRPLSGKARPMPYATRTPSGRTVLRTLIILTLLGNLLVGVLLITTRAQLDDQGRASVADRERVSDLGVCVAGQLRDLGTVLDERQTPNDRAIRIERELWRELRAVLLSPNGTLPEITAAISAYLDALDELQSTRAGTPYPDPDRCTG